MTGTIEPLGQPQERLSFVHKIAGLLNVRDREIRLVGLMLAHSFLNGVPKALTYSVGSALFLKHHGARALPYAYVVSAVIVTLFGVAFLKTGRTLSLATRLQGVLWLALLGEIGLRVGLGVLGPKTGSLAFPVWSELEWSLLELEYWTLAGAVFNVQEGKRVFALLGMGELLSSSLLNLLLPVLVRGLHAVNVLFVSALGAALSIAVVRHIASLSRERLEAGDEEASDEGAAEATGNRKAQDRHVAYLLALVAFFYASVYFLDNVLSDRAEARFVDEDALAGFFGVFWGTCAFLTLVARLGVSAYLRRRFGLRLGLLAAPAVVFLGLASASAVNATMGLGAAVFWILVVTRMLDYAVRDTLDWPSTMLLYQPLPAAVRSRAQARAQGIVGPLACGATGVVLMVLQGHFHVGPGGIAGIAAAVACGWLCVANVLRRGYGPILTDALVHRRRVGVSLSLDDPQTKAVVERGIESDQPGVAVRAAAARAPGSASGPALPLMESIVAHPGSTIEERVRVAVACGKVGGRRAGAILLRLMDRGTEKERRAALQALAACGWQAAGADVARVHGWLDEEVAASARAVEALCNLDLDPGSLLERALVTDRERSRHRVLSLLALLHDPHAIRRAGMSLGGGASDDIRAIAVELVLTTIGRELAQTVGVILEDATPAELLAKLARQTQVKRLTRAAQLAELIERRGALHGEWTTVCAMMHAMGAVNDARVHRLDAMTDAAGRGAEAVDDAGVRGAIARASTRDGIVGTMATWALARLSMAEGDRNGDTAAGVGGHGRRTRVSGSPPARPERSRRRPAAAT